MAVIRDVMPPFELFQPASVDAALELLDRYGGDAWVLAGGLDSFDWLKDRIKRPAAVVDLGGIEELKGIRPWQDGLEIGTRQGFDIRKAVDEPVVVAGDGFDLSLLQHDFADPDAVKRRVAAPGKIAPVPVEPGEQSAAKGSEIHLLSAQGMCELNSEI